MLAMSTGSYHLDGIDVAGQCCQGTACFVARFDDLARWTTAQASSNRVFCLGHCHESPACATHFSRPKVEIRSSQAIVLERVANGPIRNIETYQAVGGFAGLHKALRLGPLRVGDEIAASELRGRGGAGYPTARKWKAVSATPPGMRYVVCNADEGDAGAYIDRMLLEDDPFAVIEGLCTAGFAVGATRGYIYVRREYPAALAVVEAAVAEARRSNVIGDHLLGDGPPFDVQVVSGHGSYVCGEETALLNSIEGRRPSVRVRPPFPATHGLFGRPTAVNNVETLVAAAWIVREGAARYAAIGTPDSRGTKAVSLNSLFARPGLYEVDFGVSLRDIVEGCGGGLRTGELHGLMIGGPLSGVVPPWLLDTRFTFEDLHRIGASVGHGGVIAFDERTSIIELMQHVFAFGAHESCGTCTPCRIGTAQVAEVFAQLAAASSAKPPPLQTPTVPSSRWLPIIEALGSTSLCGHGVGLSDFARSLVTYYSNELASCLD
jgi:NADH:ubiquinone oxidoreductase subunit F (NADH-binding)